MKYTTFIDNKGRTIYKASIDRATYFTDNLEQLKEKIKNHVPIKEGTFK